MKKRMFLLFAAVLMSAAAFSQGFGVRAGVNLQTINGKNGAGDKLDNKMSIGFSGGVNYEISIAEGFYLQPGLNFAVKGAKGTQDYGLYEADVKMSLSYIELPIHFVYKAELGSGKIIVGFGEVLSGKLFVFNMLNCTSKLFSIKRNDENFDVEELIDYEEFCKPTK
jgi:hypothetical protein